MADEEKVDQPDQAEESTDAWGEVSSTTGPGESKSLVEEDSEILRADSSSDTVGDVSAVGFEEMSMGEQPEDDPFDFDLDGISLDEDAEDIVGKENLEKQKRTANEDPEGEEKKAQSPLTKIMNKAKAKKEKAKKPKKEKTKKEKSPKKNTKEGSKNDQGFQITLKLEPRTLILGGALLIVPMLAIMLIGLPSGVGEQEPTWNKLTNEVFWVGDIPEVEGSLTGVPELGFVVRIIESADREFDREKTVYRLRSFLIARQACLGKENGGRNRKLLQGYLDCRKAVLMIDDPSGLSRDQDLIEKNGGSAKLLSNLGEEGFQNWLEHNLQTKELKKLLAFELEAWKKGGTEFRQLRQFLDQIAPETGGQGWSEPDSWLKKCRCMGGIFPLEENLYRWFPREEEVTARVLLFAYEENAGRPAYEVEELQKEALTSVKNFLADYIDYWGSAVLLPKSMFNKDGTMLNIGPQKSWTDLKNLIGGPALGFNSFIEYLYYCSFNGPVLANAKLDAETLDRRQALAGKWLKRLGISAVGESKGASIAECIRQEFKAEVADQLSKIKAEEKNFNTLASELVSFIKDSMHVNTKDKEDALLQLSTLAGLCGKTMVKVDVHKVLTELYTDHLDPREGLGNLITKGEELINKPTAKPADFRVARSLFSVVLLKQDEFRNSAFEGQISALAAEARFLIAASYLYEAKAVKSGKGGK